MRVAGSARWRDGYTKNQCAGWDPESLGFRAADEAANQKLYADLLPAGTIDQATGVVSKSKVTVDRFSTAGIVVTEGLKPGQWIVIAGVHSLTKGQKVRILDQE